MQLLLPLSSEEAVSIHVAHLDPRAVSEGDVPGFLTQEDVFPGAKCPLAKSYQAWELRELGPWASPFCTVCVEGGNGF